MKQKLKLIIALFLIPIFLLSCVSKAAVPAPTATAAPTITPTPVPQSLADAPDLSTWVEDYVHAYEGKVTVNGAEMDADQLTAAIRQKPDEFTQTKLVNSEKYSFAIVNGIPLGFKSSDTDSWQKSTLMQLASLQNIYIGTQIVHYELNNPLYSKIANNEFNFYLTNGELDWPARWISENVFDYKAADEIFTFAQNSNKPVHMYHLLDGQNIPDWLLNSTFTSEKYQEIMRSRINSIMEKYKGKISLYSVVNEAFNWNKLKGFWYEKIGPNYIVEAFRTARKADAGATLIYNDVNVSNGAIDGHENAVFKLVNDLKAQGILDGVGMQMHVDGSTPFDAAKFLENLQRYKKAEIPVYITEFDVDISQVTGDEAERQDVKAKIYQEALDSYLASGTGNSFCMFGFSSAVSWMPDADANIFDKNYQPQSSYYAVSKVLFAHIP